MINKIGITKGKENKEPLSKACSFQFSQTEKVIPKKYHYIVFHITSYRRHNKTAIVIIISYKWFLLGDNINITAISIAFHLGKKSIYTKTTQHAKQQAYIFFSEIKGQGMKITYVVIHSPVNTTLRLSISVGVMLLLLTRHGNPFSIFIVIVL